MHIQDPSWLHAFCSLRGSVLFAWFTIFCLWIPETYVWLQTLCKAFYCLHRNVLKKCFYPIQMHYAQKLFCLFNTQSCSGWATGLLAYSSWSWHQSKPLCTVGLLLMASFTIKLKIHWRGKRLPMYLCIGNCCSFSHISSSSVEIGQT